jgi:hemerythrin
MSPEDVDEKFRHHIGITELDRQHHELVDHLARLKEATANGYGYAAGAILSEIEILARIHFAVEETLMGILFYEELDAHAREHSELGKKLAQFKRRAQDLELSGDVADYIRNWLNNHVGSFDKRLAEHIRKHCIERINLASTG